MYSGFVSDTFGAFTSANEEQFGLYFADEDSAIQMGAFFDETVAGLAQTEAARAKTNAAKAAQEATSKAGDAAVPADVNDALSSLNAFLAQMGSAGGEAGITASLGMFYST